MSIESMSRDSIGRQGCRAQLGRRSGDGWPQEWRISRLLWMRQQSKLVAQLLRGEARVQYVFVAWTVAAAILVIAMAAAGRTSSGSYLGILRDGRGRYSLSRFQVLLWTTVVLSLLAAVFVARLIDGTRNNALDIQIPQTVLLVLGVSVGSTVTAGAIKAGKDNQDQT